MRRIAPLLFVLALLGGCGDAPATPTPYMVAPFVARPTAEPLVFTGGKVAPRGEDCPASHPIKGNADSLIYHVPGGASYARTIPEDCFATEGAAREAGYRRAMR